MKRSIICTVLLLYATYSLSQTGTLSNIQVSQRTDGTGYVDIYFNLNGSAAAYNMILETSFDGGSTYTPIPPAFISGNITAILPGNNKHIVWDGLGSFPGTFSTQAKLKLIAADWQPCPDIPTFTDTRDGQVYFTVQIGGQCWIKENMKYLPVVTGPGNGSFTDPSYYVYGYNDINVSEAKDTDNFQNYGALYNWWAALTACPPGWQLPDDTDWTQLTEFAAAEGFPDINVANGAGNALKSCRQVNSPLGSNCNTSEHPRWDSNSTHHGFDEFGFSALPGGYTFASAEFYSMGLTGSWWSSSISPDDIAIIRNMGYDKGEVEQNSLFKFFGLSVRCIRVYQLNLGVSPPGAGTVYGQGEYTPGKQVEITAEAHFPFMFLAWMDENNNVLSTAASFVYTMPAQNVTLGAFFWRWF